MRTNIEIDDVLLRRAMRVTGARTKKSAIEEALMLAVRLHKEAAAIQKLWGIGWEGDFKAMRANEHRDWDLDWRGANRDKSKSAA